MTSNGAGQYSSMLTSFPTTHFTLAGGFDKFSDLQLCPWFLEKYQKNKFRTFHQLRRKGLVGQIATIWRKFRLWRTSSERTPMDVLDLFDATLLHEMTHAIPHEPAGDIWDTASPYGWRNCVAHSFCQGINNADNYVYFSIGSRLISPHNNLAQRRPTIDGSIRSIRTGRFKRYLYDTPRVESQSSRTGIAHNSNCSSAADRSSIVDSQKIDKVYSDNFLGRDSQNLSWYDMQQFILEQAMDMDTGSFVS